LNVNIHRTIGVWGQAGTIADAVPVEWIRHKVILRIPHRNRPECLVRREPSRREAQDVVERTGERAASAVGIRPPVHRLLRHVHRAGEKLGVRGAQEHPVAGLAQPIHGDPPVDPLGFDPGVNLSRDERQPEADQSALDDGIPQDHVLGEEGGADDKIDANRANEDRQASVCSAHIIILPILVQLLSSACELPSWIASSRTGSRGTANSFLWLRMKPTYNCSPKSVFMHFPPVDGEYAIFIAPRSAVEPPGRGLGPCILGIFYAIFKKSAALPPGRSTAPTGRNGSHLVFEQFQLRSGVPGRLDSRVGPLIIL
jgi:hypothetical protein